MKVIEEQIEAAKNWLSNYTNILGTEHSDLVTSLNDFALLPKDQGKYEEACHSHVDFCF